MAKENLNSNAQANGATATENNIEVNDLVVVNNNQAVTTSLKVAEVFGKLHKNVIAAIKALECSELFRELNFKLSEKIYKNGNVTKKQPFYYITRDGMSFLVFKFTGKKAAMFTEAYIKAFNTMETRLREIHEQGLIDNKPETFSFVEVVDGRVLTTSLKVAKVFEKPHDEILRLISDLDCDYDFRKRNLELQFTISNTPTGKVRRETVRAMTCAGFSRLVAKLTGRKAAQLKDVYLQAFYDAEEKLRIEKEAQLLPHDGPQLPKIDNPITKRLFDLRIEHEKLRNEISTAGQEAMCSVTELLNDVENAYALRQRALKKVLMMQVEREASLLASDYINGVGD